MRGMRWVVLVMGLLLAGCGSGSPAYAPVPTISSVVPSVNGIPNSVAMLWPYAFVSVQGTGQIFTYYVARGVPVPVGKPFATPCSEPNGMAIAPVAGVNVMAVGCYDTGSLLTLAVQADGTLSALGTVAGLPGIFPGIAVDGTNVFVPLYGVSGGLNGAVARVSVASPTKPVVTGMTTLASPVPGGFANPGSLTAANGFVYLTAGSESGPQNLSSTIQVVDEASMTLVGNPFVVPHSPQRVAVQGGVAYVTFYDAAELESIDVSNPASLKLLEAVPLSMVNPICSAIPIVLRNSYAYVGCYGQGLIHQFDVSVPTQIRQTGILTGVPYPQSFVFAQQYLLASSGVQAGELTEINVNAEFGQQ